MPTHDVEDAGVFSPRAANRRSDVDVLRGIAICAVVALHTSWTLLRQAPLREPSGEILAVVHLASGFGVPLFLGLSAIGLSLRHGQPFGGAGAYLAFLRTRAQRLLPAYVAWSLASLLLRDPALAWPPQQVASTLLTGSADIQFYFVPLLFQLYLLWPLLRSVSGRAGGSRQLIALGSAAAISLLAWKRMIPTTFSALPFLAVHVVGALLLKTALLDRPERRRVAMAAAAVAAVASLVCTVRAFYGMLVPPVSPLAMAWASFIFQPRPALYGVAAITLCFACAAGIRPDGTRPTAPWLPRALAALGRRSYAVYLTHLIVASNLTRHLIAPATVQSPNAAVAVAALAASFGVTLAASLALGAALERHRALAWLVGAQATRRAAGVDVA